MPPLRVSVVMPTHQRAALVPAAMAAALADPACAELVVVADGCTDGTGEVVRTIAATDARMQLVELDPNRGEQGARLAGVQAAGSEVVLCVDDDVVLAPGTVAGHLAHHRPGTRLVVAGLMPVSPPPASWEVARRRYADRYDRHAAGWGEDPASVLTGLWAGNVSCRRDDYLAAAATMRNDLAHHADQEMGLALRAVGCTGVHDPALRAEHRFDRDLAGALRDAHRSGIGYATLLPQHPDALAAPEQVFAPEIAHRGLRLVERAVTRPRAAHALDRADRLLTGAARRGAPAAPAMALTALRCRAEYARGFLEAGGQWGASRSTARTGSDGPRSSPQEPGLSEYHHGR